VLGRDGGSGFDVWETAGGTHVRIETHAPAAWEDGLARRGHDVRRAESDVAGFGHAHLIDMTPAGPVGARRRVRSLHDVFTRDLIGASPDPTNQGARHDDSHPYPD
jgi:hypothetical protein